MNYINQIHNNIFNIDYSSIGGSCNSPDLCSKYKLLEPVEYTLESGGKNSRALIIKYVQNLLNNDNNSVTERIIKDINLLHNSSLVIDDIQDGSLKRRGLDCAYIKYGTPISINAGYLQCFGLLNEIKKIILNLYKEK